MKEDVLACTGCGHPLEGAEVDLQLLSRCPHCRVPLQLEVFPALARVGRNRDAAQPVVWEGEAPCYFHETRRATVACDRCGRLVCALCDLELGDQHLCPECLPILEREGRDSLLQRSRIRYDSIVWLLLLLGILFLGLFGPLMAGAALVLALWKARAASSRVDRSQLRMLLAIPVALLEIGGGIWLWLVLFG